MERERLRKARTWWLFLGFCVVLGLRDFIYLHEFFFWGGASGFLGFRDFQCVFVELFYSCGASGF